MTATDFYPDAGVILLKEHKTANKTDKPRCIVLTPSVVMLLKGLVKKHPSGPLFRNEAGRRWLKDGIVLAMRRISKRIGVKVVAYGYRHSYATDCLSAGIGDSQTAALLGHGSTAMLHKHYSHLTSQMDVLRKAARRIRG
jgi:integrase